MAAGQEAPKQKRVGLSLEIHPPPMDHLLFFETTSWFEKIRLGEKEVKKEIKKEEVGMKRSRPEDKDWHKDGEEEQGEAEDENQGKPKQKTKIRDELFWFKADVVDIENETTRMVTVPSSSSSRPKRAKRPKPDSIKRDLRKFINAEALKARISERVLEYGAEVEVTKQVDEILSLAVQNWMRYLLERLVFQCKKRRDSGKDEANVQILNSVGTWLRSRSKREALEKERESLQAKKVSGKLSSPEKTRLLAIEQEFSKGGEKIEGLKQEQEAGSNQENVDLVSFVKQSVIPELMEGHVLSPQNHNKKINMKDGIALMRSTKCSSTTLYKTMVKS